MLRKQDNPFYPVRILPFFKPESFFWTVEGISFPQDQVRTSLFSGFIFLMPPNSFFFSLVSVTRPSQSPSVSEVPHFFGPRQTSFFCCLLNNLHTSCYDFSDTHPRPSGRMRPPPPDSHLHQLLFWFFIPLHTLQDFLYFPHFWSPPLFNLLGIDPPLSFAPPLSCVCLGSRAPLTPYTQGLPPLPL